jgi:multicomponent K+:H+ antiporter subunit E
MRRVAKHGTRRFPPLLVGLLTVMWLLLNQTLAPTQVLAGAVLATALTWMAASLRPLQPQVARPFEAAMLVLNVLADIVRSNIGVARIVLGLVRDREIESGFLDVPLELRDPHGLAVLAAILTATPGTVWVELSSDGSRLTLHVLDLRDEREWIEWIKSRYERPLVRIFE